MKEMDSNSGLHAFYYTSCLLNNAQALSSLFQALPKLSPIYHADLLSISQTQSCQHIIPEKAIHSAIEWMLIRHIMCWDILLDA